MRLDKNEELNIMHLDLEGLSIWYHITDSFIRLAGKALMVKYSIGYQIGLVIGTGDGGNGYGSHSSI